MFGLEDQKKKKQTKEFVFELENELRDHQKHRQIKIRVEEQIQKIKRQLRSGTGQEDFETYGLLLHGYTSLLKVMSRFKK